jgi:hypothetical protein
MVAVLCGLCALTDDLRPYAVLQFLPMLLIPLMLALLPGRRPAAPLVAGVAVYAVGKLAEVTDRGILGLGGEETRAERDRDQGFYLPSESREVLRCRHAPDQHGRRSDAIALVWALGIVRARRSC